MHMRLTQCMDSLVHADRIHITKYLAKQSLVLALLGFQFTSKTLQFSPQHAYSIGHIPLQYTLFSLG